MKSTKQIKTLAAVALTSLVVNAAEKPRIYLVGKELDLGKAELLYSFDEFRPEDWTRFCHGSEKKWDFRGKTLVGGGFAEPSHGQVLYKTPVKGDMVMEFDARTIAPSYHDLVWLWGVRFGAEEWNAGYLGCLAGWWSDLAGIESLNDAYVPSCINHDRPLEPGRWYHIVSGSVKGVHFIAVDGRLVTRFATASREEQSGYFGFGFYESYCEYANLKVWKPATVRAGRRYEIAQTVDVIQGGTVEMKVRDASCTVAKTGARALSYFAKGQERLWRPPVWNVTTNRVWTHGGLVLCWPWFAPRANGVDKGFGGFAYASPFEVRRHEETEGRSVLALGLRDARAFPELWDGAPFDLEVVYTLTPESLTVDLKTKNLSDREMRINAGFHPYFDLEDRMQAQVKGLNGAGWELSGERYARGDCVLRAGAKWPFESLPLTHYIDDVFSLADARLQVQATLPNRDFAIESEGTSHVVVHAFRAAKDNRIWHAPVCIEPCSYWDRSAHVLSPGTEDAVRMRIVPAERSW